MEKKAKTWTGEAAQTNRPSSSAFRLSLRDLLATAVIVAVAVKF